MILGSPPKFTHGVRQPATSNVPPLSQLRVFRKPTTQCVPKKSPTTGNFSQYVHNPTTSSRKPIRLSRSSSKHRNSRVVDRSSGRSKYSRNSHNVTAPFPVSFIFLSMRNTQGEGRKGCLQHNKQKYVALADCCFCCCGPQTVPNFPT